MSALLCNFCGHENPADAKFCNSCASSLKLRLCGHCGAIDNVSSTACYKCGTPFPVDGGAQVMQQGADAQAGDAFGAELERAAQARRRSNRTLLLALIALVAGAAASYLMYTSGAPPGLITASRQSSAPISRPPDLASPLPAATLPPPDAGAASVGNPVTAETQTLSIADQPPVANEASTLPPAAEPEIPLQVDDNLPGKQPCTAAVAALGLCNP